MRLRVVAASASATSASGGLPFKTAHALAHLRVCRRTLSRDLSGCRDLQGGGGAAPRHAPEPLWLLPAGQREINDGANGVFIIRLWSNATLLI